MKKIILPMLYIETGVMSKCKRNKSESALLRKKVSTLEKFGKWY